MSAQVLFYPLVDPHATEDAARYRSDHMIKRRQVQSFWAMYSSGAIDARRSPYANLLAGADHAGLAPALFVLAGHDSLLEEGRAYAAKLRASGVRVAEREWPGLHHGFAALVDLCPEAGEALDEVAEFLRSALGKT